MSSGIARSPSPKATSLRPDSTQALFEDQNAATPSLSDAETTVRWKNMSPIPQEVGLPPDGRWDHNAAYNNRYCFQHGEDEFHLDTGTRWMLPTDFKLPYAKGRLQLMLEQFNRCNSVFDPHSRRHQAECTSGLWSQIDSVIQRSTLDGQPLYLIRWKACWTPRSCIDNDDWLQASLRANRNPQRQRSSRVEQTAEARSKKNEEIMRVLRLD